MSGKAARRQRRRERLRELTRSRIAHDFARDDVRPVPEPVSCAEADLDVLAGHLSTIAAVLDDLEDAARAARARWAAADHVDELRIALEEIHDTALGWRERLTILDARIQRFRDLDEHFHLVGGRVMRLVPVEARYSDAHPDDDIPF